MVIIKVEQEDYICDKWQMKKVLYIDGNYCTIASPQSSVNRS